MALLALAGGSGVVFADATDESASRTSTAEFKVEAGDTGKLTLDEVPDLNFGKTYVKDIATRNVTLNLDSDNVTETDRTKTNNGTKGLNLQVSDYRGGTAGWNLYAQLSTFKEINSNDELKATELNLSLEDNHSDNPITTSIVTKDIVATNTATPILTTKENPDGLGKNVLSVVKPDPKDGKGTQLTISQNTTVKAATYQADITWTLGNTIALAAANSNE